MRIFVTGGAGMVGRNLVLALSADGHEVLAPPRRELDLADEAAVASFMGRTIPDVVVHAAGTVGGIRANVAEPARFLTENLRVGVNVITAARSAGVKKLLNLGSSCMYPRNADNPLVEEQILTGELEPTNEGYALAKIVCGRLCDYIRSEDPSFLYKTLVPCNLYGPYDNFDPQSSHMLPAAIRKVDEAVASGIEEVEIWGDGNARREFMFVGDLAAFIVFALKSFERVPNTINVGLGHDHSINEYYRAVAQVLGYRGRFVHDLSKPAGMRQKLVDVGKLGRLGWRATTGLHEGIRQTYEFFKQESGK